MANVRRCFSNIGIFLVFACIFLASPNATKGDVLTLGTISANPLDEIRTFQPFAHYLADQLAADGITKIKVIITPGIQETIDLIQRNELDLFIDSSLTALIVNREAGSKFLLRRWKKGRGKYRSIIFATADSGIRNLNGLVGKIVAFEEPFSTSGYILPALEMLRANLSMAQVDNIRSQPKPETVGYVMANDNETQVAWLERDRIAAAAMAEKDFKALSENALKPLRAIHMTPYVPYHVIVHRSGLKPDLIKRIKHVLLSTHTSDEGRSILQNFERTTKFDDIPSDLLNEVRQYEPYLKNLNIDQ